MSPPTSRSTRDNDTRFPHQPTDLRQSFDEEQFECYRCLGDHIAWNVFGHPARELARELADDLSKRGPVAEKLPHQEYVPKLFAAVQQRWSEAPQALSEIYAAANRAWSEIHRDLSKINDLEALSQDLYPELTLTVSGGGSPPSRVELHTVARMLAIMENSWIALSLKRTSAAADEPRLGEFLPPLGWNERISQSLANLAFRIQRRLRALLRGTTPSHRREALAGPITEHVR